MTVRQGAVVVVTGGGNGIGAALARRFAADKATVVVNDLDPDAAAAVAADIDGVAIAADAVHPEHLITEVRQRFGEIDLYCANAGVPAGGSEQAPDEDWDRAWQVNVMAHVRASRVLIGPWLERGRGHLLTTVSAAGLLTMLGAAPYSATKHAALAFAEWMTITYGDKGIRTQAICPLGVRTNMINDIGRYGEVLLEPAAIAPEAVADAVADALDDGPFLILPHPEVAKMYARRATDPDRWQTALRQIQSTIEADPAAT
ncbi:SDR family oxidoreductase [Stackebrandtia nassauensis]|uniref:Short-chain dehydrogenase/reductase SDR n=1 Tax=Stackebrandtia nassauensis (strain DSM 44728 / CIP 108903 / NRRL B-16338 / NBRC 102104 / LLR-40K-21) TaxID=446470 RepID=D3Q9A7_STANL|nr:SDR family oxidoreductase [Stackebrandtia nassauensis]ADD42589.1 short-chain dehydrogenase/reductase SDR [Stackebrandtia nassauensis DSM 44728]